MHLLEKNGGKVIGVWDIDMGPFADFILIWAGKNLADYQEILDDTREGSDGEELRRKFLPFISGCQRWLLRLPYIHHYK